MDSYDIALQLETHNIVLLVKRCQNNFFAKKYNNSKAITTRGQNLLNYRLLTNSDILRIKSLVINLTDDTLSNKLNYNNNELSNNSKENNLPAKDSNLNITKGYIE